MASNIIAIGFDHTIFSDEVKCAKWIRAHPEYTNLLTIKGFKLKTIASSKWMSWEGRKIFWWEQDLWSAKHISVARPEANVVVVTRVSTELFTPAEIPPLSLKTQEKLRAQEKKQDEKDRAQVERRQKLLEKRKRKRASMKGSGTFLAKEFAKAEAALEAKEQKEKNPIKRVKKKPALKAAPQHSQVDVTEILNVPSLPEGMFFDSDPVS